MIALYVVLFISLYAGIFFLYSYFQHKTRFKTRVDKEFTPEVTVLIPAYNEERTLARTLDYVFRMTYPKEKLKVVVVDDGSTDSTYSIAKGYPGVTVYHKENEGCKAYPVNYGLKRIRSDLVFILDADCMPAKDCLLKLVQYTKDEKTMAVITQIKMYKPRGFLSRLQAIEFSGSAFVRKNLNVHGSLNITPGGVLFKREFFDKHGYYDTSSIVEDFEIGMRVKAKGYDIAQAIDTYIMTYPHTKVRGLFKERLRWAYGGLTIYKKYGFMFGFKHGELGGFFMPLGVFFIIIPVILALRVVLISLQEGALRSGMFSGVGYDLAYSIANYQIIIPYRFVYYLIGALVLIGFFGFMAARRLSGLRRRIVGTYFWYVAVYLFFLGVVNGTAAVMFALGIKPKWAVKRSIQV